MRSFPSCRAFLAAFTLVSLSVVPWLFAWNKGGSTNQVTECCNPIYEIPSNVQISQAKKVHKTQGASNAQGTLYGENAGDFIILQWDLNDDAAEYHTYRSRSLAGPWEQVLRTSQGAARTSGAKVDYTPDARLMDLCYKVEAIDSKGLVIEFYEPICVPKFVP
jgi:hypothetical protein